MILVFSPDRQQEKFYAIMGRNFASLDIAKELERQVYNSPYTTWYVETVNNIAIAFVSVCEHKKHYFVDNLFVHYGWRGQGIASKLIERVVEDFTDKPIKCIAVNPFSIKIFERFGFEGGRKNGKWTEYTKH